MGEKADLIAAGVHSCASAASLSGVGSGGGGDIHAALSNAVIAVTRRPLVKESLSALGRTTESLMRMMRLDVVLLGSREEVTRGALAHLEEQWEVMEQLLQEQRRMDDKKGNGTDKVNNDDPKSKDERKKVWNCKQCASTAHWDGGEGDGADGDEKNNAAAEYKQSSPEELRLQSWRAKNKRSLVNDEVKRSMVTRTDDPEKVSPQLANSDFDSGLSDDTANKIQEEGQRASLFGHTEDIINNIVNERQVILDEQVRKDEQPPYNHVPFLRRLFQPRDRDRSTGKGHINGGNDHDVDQNANLSAKRNTIQDDPFFTSTLTIEGDSSVGGNKSPPLRPFAGGRRQRMKSASTIGDGSVVNDNKPPLFQLFVGAGRRSGLNSENQNSINEGGAHSNNPLHIFGGSINQAGFANPNSSIETNNENTFQRMFRKNGRNLDASSYTRETVDITQSTSPASSTDASWSQYSANSQNSVLIPEEEDTRTLSSLRIKLRVCDSCVSSLHQLLSYQTRNLLDLRRERDALKSSTCHNSMYQDFELENFRNRLGSAKLDGRRKARLVEDAQKREKMSHDHEERLKDELESIRIECFILNMQINKEDQRSRGGDISQQQISRDRVLIIHGRDGGESESSEWRTNGIREKQQAAAAWRLLLPPGMPPLTDHKQS